MCQILSLHWPTFFWCAGIQNDGQVFGALRCFPKQDPKKMEKELSRGGGSLAGWWREEHLVFLTLWSRIVSSLQGRTSGTSHVLWPAVSRMLPKSSGLWDWAFSCVPGAAHCISPWMDFCCYIFLSLSPLGIYISYHFVFQFQPLFGYMEML